jgi:protein-disulfide isomerase
MASGVFGIPISVETLRATGEYNEPITQNDVADYAMKMINAGAKDIDAQNFVDNLKKRFVFIVYVVALPNYFGFYCN